MSRRDDNEPGGYSSGNPFRRRSEDADDALGAGNETPVDLAAVQADDALLNMLTGGETGRGAADAELARVLVAWRRDVDAEPVGELVDTDNALAAISAARKPAPRRHPVLGPVAAAAAVLVIAFSGVGLVAKSAQPEDQLWSLTKVLYADYARSVETAQKVRTELEQIDKALAEGKTTPAEARESLERVEAQLAVVDEAQGRTELATERKKLEEKLDEMPTPDDAGSPTDPAAPELPPSSDAPVAPVPSESPSSPPSEPPVQTEPTTEPSDPPTPSVGPVEPAPGTSDPSPRSSPPGDATGSTPPETSPNG